MMEAVRTSETSVDNYFTRQYNPEDSSEHLEWAAEDCAARKLCALSIICIDTDRFSSLSSEDVISDVGLEKPRARKFYYLNQYIVQTIISLHTHLYTSASVMISFTPV
jgi:hypothetical protein